MRGLKTLSSFLLVTMCLMFIGSGAASTDYSSPTLQVSGEYKDSDVNSEYVAKIGVDSLTVNNKDGSTVYSQSLPSDRSSSRTARRIELPDDGSSEVYITYIDGGNNPSAVHYTETGEKWSYQMDQSAYPEYSSKIDVSENYVATATKNGHYYVLDKEGSLQNHRTIGELTFGEVKIDETDSALYLTGSTGDDLDNQIRKVEIGTGNTLWKNTLSSAPNSLGMSSENIYVSMDDGTILGMDKTGSEISSTSITNTRSITATDEALIAGTSDGKIYESVLSDLTFGDGYDYGAETIYRLSSYKNAVTVATDSNFRFYQGFTLPESTTVTEESTNLVTGDFALTSSAGIYAGVKGISAAAAGLGIWELGVRDWLFGTNDADEQLWQDDIRANAVTLEDNRNNILSASELSEDALFGDAMAEARAVGVQEYNNGSSKAEAKAKVENTVENYYSDVERVVVNGYNNEILNLQQDYNNANDLGVSFSKPFKSNFNGLAIVNESYTLPNGESMTTYEVVRDDGTRIATLESYEGVGLTTESSADNASASYLEGSAHYDVIQGVRDTRSNAITNVNSIVDNIYNNYNQSEINVSEELSALELVESLSTDYGETGSYDYAAASLARSGQPTDLDSAFNITYNGEDMEGALFASDAVVGSQVDVGTTYNGYDGNAVFVKQGENSAELVELEGEFTVNSITSLDDGSKLSNTTLQESSVYTQDISDLQEEINNLESQINEGSGIGGGLFGGLGAETYLILGLILVLAGALFA
jgi:hypothetical protein